MGEIRFVGTGETRGYPYLVCKNECSQTSNVISMLQELGWEDLKSMRDQNNTFIYQLKCMFKVGIVAL